MTKPHRPLAHLTPVLLTIVLLSPATVGARPEVAPLELKHTVSFSFMWNDDESGANLNGGFWAPMPPPGFHALSHHAVPHYDYPTGAALVARDLGLDPLNPALKHPTDYAQIWNDTDSGATRSGSFWAPTAPPGYTCLGTVAWPGNDGAKPPLDAIACVRNDLVVPGKAGDKIWHDQDSGASFGRFGAFYALPVEIRDTGFGIDVGGFIGVPSFDAPGAGTVFALSGLAAVGPTLTASELDELITTYGPVIRLHSGDPYRPDSVEYSLATWGSLCHGVIRNSGSYSDISQAEIDAAEANCDGITASTLLDASEAADLHPQSGDVDFKKFIKMNTSVRFSSGDVSRAKAYVRVRPMDQVFVDVQYWIYYPFNGHGKFTLDVGPSDDVLSQETPDVGRHYGDWEVVAVRFARDDFDDLVPVNVYMSAHSFEHIVPWASVEKKFGTHPVAYAAHYSHAHYPTAGRHLYEVAKTLEVANVHIYTAHLRDETDHGPDFDTYAPGAYEVVSSGFEDVPIDSPTWLEFRGRWGQFEPNFYGILDAIGSFLTDACDAPGVDCGLDGFVELFAAVDAGPRGPSSKPIWPGPNYCQGPPADGDNCICCGPDLDLDLIPNVCDPSDALINDLKKAVVWRSRSKLGRVSAKGTLVASTLDASEGFTFAFDDAGSLDVGPSVTVDQCETDSKGKIRCRNGKRTRATFKPTKNPDEYKFKIQLKSLDIEAPQAGPLQMSISQGSDDIDYTGEYACEVKTGSMKCQ